MEKEPILEYYNNHIVKEAKGNDWHPVVCFKCERKGVASALNTLREKSDAATAYQFVVDDAIFVKFEDGAVTFGVKDPAPVAYYHYRTARVGTPLFNISPSDEELLECYESYKEMCENQGFRLDNHTVMAFGQLAIAFSDCNLTIGYECEEGSW